MHKLLLLLLILTNLVFAKDYITPPSIGLRTEVSYVSQMTLNSIKHIEADKWHLSFSLISNIHNESAQEVTILVSRKLAQSLELKVDYVVAYLTHYKTKIMGQKKYLPNTNGAVLMETYGANPAIFRFNKKLVSQLQTYPKHAKANPQKFIDTIINGMFEKDPKIQEFFVRELLNWIDLHQHLSKEHYVRLLKIYNSNTATDDTIAAFLGSSNSFQRSVGVKSLKNKAINILNNFSLDLNPFNNQPSMIYNALLFLEMNDLGNWELYSRWMHCNIPSITEKAILNLKKIDANKTNKLIKSRLQDTLLKDTSRRVLKRFYVQ